MEQTSLIRLAGISYDDVVNGPGLRVVVFLQGCDFHCPGCQNATTWSKTGGIEITADALLAQIRKDKIAKKVTWSGGEPTLQYRAVLPVVRTLKQLGYKQMMFTGCTPDELVQKCELPEFVEFLQTMEYVVVGRYVQELRSLNIRYRGSTNQRILTPQAITQTDTGWMINWKDVSDMFDRS